MSNTNYSSLAGEFSVLSRLALLEVDAGLTLGNTKGVDILVSNPNGNLKRLEVKTKAVHTIKGYREIAHFGKILCEWQMGKVHESIIDDKLLYCFVLIDPNNDFATQYFIVPSKVVAEYVKTEHEYWEQETGKIPGQEYSGSDMRMFRIGFDTEVYPIPTPRISEYSNNWDLIKQ